MKIVTAFNQMRRASLTYVPPLLPLLLRIEVSNYLERYLILLAGLLLQLMIVYPLDLLFPQRNVLFGLRLCRKGLALLQWSDMHVQSLAWKSGCPMCLTIVLLAVWQFVSAMISLVRLKQIVRCLRY